MNEHLWGESASQDSRLSPGYPTQALNLEGSPEEPADDGYPPLHAPLTEATDLNSISDFRKGARLTVRSLRLSDFRNYEALEFVPSEGLNLIVGPNAQGKTNLLEALDLLATTRLLRGHRDAEAVRQGADRTEVRAEVGDPAAELGLTLAAGVRKRATLNGAPLPRASDLIGRLPAVCVSSLDLPIVTAGASERRLFLDLELCALFPVYLQRLATYKRALEQRNALLKHEPPASVEAFEPWELKLASAGVELRSMRRAFVEQLHSVAAERHAELGGGESLSLQMVQADPAEVAEDLLDALRSNRAQDLHRGATGVGPHRDDVLILVGGREARHYGSQGQQRTSVIAIKLGTHEVLRERLGEPPLLLLDDIFSDLDAHRRQALVEWVLANAGQALITCTEAEAAGSAVVARSKVFRVLEGQVAEG